MTATQQSGKPKHTQDDDRGMDSTILAENQAVLLHGRIIGKRVPSATSLDQGRAISCSRAEDDEGLVITCGVHDARSRRFSGVDESRAAGVVTLLWADRFAKTLESRLTP